MKKIPYSIMLMLLLTYMGCKNDPIKNFTNGENALKEKSYKEAADYFIKCIKSDPNYPDAYLYIAICYTNLGTNQEAMTYYKKAIDLNPDDYRIYVERAKLKIKLEDYNGAINDCQQAQMISNSDPLILKTKAYAYEKNSDVYNSISNYERAIEMGLKDGETYFLLGKLKLSIGKLNEACSYFTKAGELGYMDAYDLIKANCNKVNTLDTTKNGVFKNFPGRFSMTIPYDCEIDPIRNSTNSVFLIAMNYKNHNMVIQEIDVNSAFSSKKNAKTIYDYTSNDFFQPFVNKYPSFKLINEEKIILNGTDAYIFEYSYSRNGTDQSNDNTLVFIQYNLLGKNNKVYNLLASAHPNEFEKMKPLFKNIFNTFKIDK